MAVFVTDAPDVPGSFDRETGVGVSSRCGSHSTFLPGTVHVDGSPLKTRKD